tara:strand:- start:207 stop:599 length:393 start_codon:yes stop_codon:yes gene_type:complete
MLSVLLLRSVTQYFPTAHLGFPSATLAMRILNYQTTRMGTGQCVIAPPNLKPRYAALKNSFEECQSARARDLNRPFWYVKKNCLLPQRPIGCNNITTATIMRKALPTAGSQNRFVDGIAVINGDSFVLPA